MKVSFSWIIYVGLAVLIALGVMSQGSISSSWVSSSPFLLASIIGAALCFFHRPEAYCLLILAMLFSPEIVVASLPGRDIVIRIEDLMIAGLMLGWLGRMAMLRNTPIITMTPLNGTIGLYLFFSFLATTNGVLTEKVNFLKGIFYILKFFEYFVIYFMVTNTLSQSKSKGDYQQYIIFFLITFFCVNAFGLSQLGSSDRIGAPFEGDVPEPNTLGGYQVLLLGVILGLFLHAKKILIKIILASLAIFAIVPFLYTFSRSSYMSLVVMYVSLFIFGKQHRLLLYGGFLVGLFLLFKFMPEKVWGRIGHTFVAHTTASGIEPVTIFGVTFGPSASSRIHSWVNILQLWGTRPFLGYGVTGLGFIDGQYARTFIETGIVGLLAFLALLRQIFRTVKKVYDEAQDPINKGLALGFIAGHMGMLAHAITSNTFFIVRIMEPYWFLLALVVMIPKIEKFEEFKRKEEYKNSIVRNAPFLVTYGKTN